MSVAKVERAERKLLNITRSVGCTDDGYNWFESAIDPFHDKTVPLKGYPDTVSASSLTSVVKLSATISCPSGITTGTWDCNIASLPWIATGQPNSTMQGVTMVLDSGGFVTGGIQIPATPSTTGIKYNGLVAIAGPTGTNLDAAANASTSVIATNILLPNVYWNDSARVVGLGFEVHNVTAELTVQGGCTVYRLPCAPYTNASASTYYQTGVSGATAIPSAVSTVSIPSIPSTEAQALLLYGSRTWLAKDGCYCVNTFNSTEISPNCSSTTQPVVYITTPNDTVQLIPAPVYNGAVPSIALPRSLFWANVNIAGAFFTGLSLTTSLKINYNVIVERFPSPNGNDLAVLAQPSPSFDPEALQMYSRCVHELPVGVPVAENGFGDWFSGVVNTVSDTLSSVSKFAAPILSVIPQTKALGMGMSIFNQIRSEPPQAPPISEGLRSRMNAPAVWANSEGFAKQINQGASRQRIPKAPKPSKKLVASMTKKVAKKEAKIIESDLKRQKSKLKRRSIARY
jgi:hypothetical protein